MCRKNASQLETHFRAGGIRGWPLTSGILLSKFRTCWDSGANGSAVYRIGAMSRCLWGLAFFGALGRGRYGVSRPSRMNFSPMGMVNGRLKSAVMVFSLTLVGRYWPSSSHSVEVTTRPSVSSRMARIFLNTRRRSSIEASARKESCGQYTKRPDTSFERKP